MKIAISTSVIQRGKTGVAQYVFALVKELREYAASHEFTLFVLEEDLPLFEFARPEMKLISVPEKFRSPIKNIFWHQTKLPKLIRQHEIDVLHIPSYRRMLWPQPCALVATIHDLAPFHVAAKYDWKRMFYGRVVAKRLAQRQNKIIAISNNTADDIARFFQVSREKISVVYNGLDHDRFFPADKIEAKKTIANRHGIRSPFFLYLSRLEHPAKNHVRLINAFNRFKCETKSEWKLVFGGSDWHGAGMIHEAIRRSPFSSDIQPLGFVANSDLPTLLRAADVFVYPSLFEGFGLPPIEAMACGTPVISSNRGSLREVVGDSAMIVNPENETELKQQLKKLATNPDLREELSLAGIAHSQKFDWKRAAAETMAIYCRAAQQRESSAVAGEVGLVDSPIALRK
jgi:glycosyltransferase involved in cell wall biosynthesis